MSIDVIIGVTLLAGYVTILAGWVGCIVALYEQDENWAFWSFVFDAVLLFGAYRYWNKARSPFLILLAGIGVTALGLLLYVLFP